MSESPRRRIFDLPITRACYRWEFLRRNSKYKLDVRRWIDRGCHVSKRTGVVQCPFDFELVRQYRADCAKWGLRLLLYPTVAIAEEDMAIYPIFSDTPERQPVMKDEKALTHWVQGLSERNLRRYFRTKKAPRRGFQLEGSRQHFRKFDLYLEVFDRRTRAQLFAEIAEGIGISVHRAKRAWHAARELIERRLRGSPRFAKKADDSPEDHLRRCEDHLHRCAKCFQVSRRSSGDWCKQMNRFLTEYARVQSSTQHP